MKKISFYSLFFVLLTFCFAACNTNVIDETSGDNVGIQKVYGKIALTENNYDDCFLSTLCEQSSITNNSFETTSNSNNRIQNFFVHNGDNVYLMSRNILSKNKEVILDTHSTTLALITLHPIFSSCDIKEYPELITLIENNSKYDKVYKEVENVVKRKANLYDEENTELLIALSDLYEDIFGEINEQQYQDTLAIVQNSSMTRATYDSPRINPTYISADITGRTLTLRAVGCTPSYYGTVQHGSDNPVNYAVPSRSDFGLLDFVGNRTFYGPKAEFNFTQDGEYRFNLSRMNAAATLDFYMRVAGSVLSTLGLNVVDDNMTVEISRMIANAITAAGSGVSDGQMSPMDWVGIAYGATTDYLSRNTSVLAEKGIWTNVRNVASILSSSFNWYNKIKGAVNIGLRLSFALNAPETIEFCLCYYNNEISTCSEASLRKISGDEQKGYANQKLFLPLKVYVTTQDENGMYTGPAQYHKIKYEVTKGGGKVSNEIVSADNDRTASVEWTLGENGSQEVRAVVIDVITEKEISEPVYFKATLEQAEVTVRLDWSQHSGNTDIDLHVIDPYGERIFFNHMTSESGGYLDRDDTHGPGPEHIHWDSAPAGTYKIYVHYYPNDDPDKSIVSYKVSVTADGITYRPATGSIAYDQMVPVGQFTIGNSTRSSINLENTDTPVNFIVPKK